MILSAQNPDVSQPGDVIINEVMANPTGLTQLPETEYVEIYNTSSTALPLNNWSFVYGTTVVTLPDTVLPVGGYAVLYRAGNSISVANGAFALGIANFPSALANSGKYVALKNSNDVLIDAFDYPSATAAKSYERATDGTWHLSTDARGGTPGEVNSSSTPPTPPTPPSPPDNSQPGDVIVNEVMANPTGLTQLPETEYVEIYNTSTSALPLNNWSFVYGTTVVTLPDTILPVGGYAVLYRAGNSISVANGALALGIANFPSALANSGKYVALKNSNDVLIDAFDYPSATAAKSYERATDGTWHLSTDARGGTPGEVNSSATPTPPPTPPPPPDNSQPGDVIINEVMANPTGLTQLPETEYVEIYNASTVALPLNNWSFVYGTTVVTLPDTVLPVGGYAVLYRAGNSISVANGALALGIANFPSALANSGKYVALKNSKDVLIDAFDYPSATAAKSYERDSDGTWHLSTDTRGGTPGEANSSATPTPPPTPPSPPDNSQPGDVIINEVMANPTGLTQLPETEYIEIYNTSSTALPLNNWSFVYGTIVITLPDTVLPVGGYAVLYRAGNSISVANGALALGIANFPSALANSGKYVALKNSNDVLIDAFDYPSATAAKSHERDSDGTWHLSTDSRGGTPGEVNSSATPTPPPTPPSPPDNSQPGDVIINEVMANPTGLTQLPETEYIEIYNTSSTALPLNNWSFVYGTIVITLPDTVLPVGGYAVLYRAGNSISVANGALALGIANFPSALSNSGKYIALKNSNDVLIDAFDYPSATAAKSHERDTDGTWHLSTDTRGGTPGEVNSSATPPTPPVPPSPPDNSQPGDVIINEVMANPTGLTLLPETEYIEIYNASTVALPLNNWSFVYGTTVITLPDTVLPVGGYAVLYRAGNSIFVANGALALGIANFPSALANSGKYVALKNSNDVLIDAFDYPSATAAKSYERDTDGTWHLSTDARGGTPGEVNSSATPTPPPTPPLPPDNSQSGDVIINEVMANPTGLTLLPETEYIEIYNTSSTALPLNDWSFIYGTIVITLPDTVLPVGGYAVLYRAGNSISVANGALALGIANFPSALANSGKYVALKNSNDVLIDAFDYPSATAAKSYERDSDGTWHLSTDVRGGTPGEVNSSATPPMPPVPPSPPDNSQPGDVIINEVMANPTGLTQLPETEYIEIYNASTVALPLNNWSFVYGTTVITLPDTVLPVGGYAVLYRAGNSISVANGALALGITNFPSALANSGKYVALKNSNDVLIDAFDYPSATAAKSYERDTDGTWHLSTDTRGGTPGEVNSPNPTPEPEPEPTPPSPPTPEPPTPTPIYDPSVYGDIVINEIMANPVGLTDLPVTEYVEIYNVSNKSLSLNAWTFIYGTQKTILPDVTIPSKGYAVMYRSGNDIYVISPGIALAIDKFPSALANNGKSLQLLNSKSVLIDSITYTSSKPAVSYERADNGSWHFCTDKRGGTPGIVNSPESTPVPEPEPTPEPVDSSAYGDILINEIMANPVGLTQLPETEYVEIYNNSDSPWSLKNWIFVYDGKASALPDTILPVGGYAVLYRAGKDIVIDSGGLALPMESFPSALANDGKNIWLKNSIGITIDSVTYAAAKPAISWERGDSIWHLSTDIRGGTPGAVNSSEKQPEPEPEPEPPTPPEPEPEPTPEPADTIKVMPSEFIFNEILPEPFVGGSEYIELYNRSDRPLPLSGLAIAIRKTDSSLGTLYPLTALTDTFPPDSYIVLTGSRDGVLNFYQTPVLDVVYELKMPTLNNSGATIVLLRVSDGIVIDEVSYLPEWHDEAIKNVKGVSLERINPDTDSQDASNWTSAVAEVGYGTPGYKNSQSGNLKTDNKVSINTPEYVAGFDYYTINYQTNKIGYHCRAEVYSTNGKKIAEIMNNQLITQSGEIRWDGKGINNQRLVQGVYVFYAELYHPNGEHKIFKKAFLVK